jgi:protease-4
MTVRILPIAMAALVALPGCFAGKFKLFSNGTEPLQESVLEQGDKKNKVLIVPVQGAISTEPRAGFLADKPSLVEEVVAQLRRAEHDPAIKAVVLLIDSPGGTATGSDVLLHEIEAFKAKTGAKVVAHFLNKATSGAYYIALGADLILAHPTTLTGSIGVIFVRAKARGLMDKIGLDAEVTKSGDKKDMGSFYRPATAEEKALFQGLVTEMGDKFVGLVKERRKLTDTSGFADARVMSAPQAKAIGLVDAIGYVADGIAAARGLAGLSADARVVTYRRNEVAEDTAYGGGGDGGKMPKLIDLEVTKYLSVPASGFYYLWAPELSE